MSYPGCSLSKYWPGRVACDERKRALEFRMDWLNDHWDRHDTITKRERYFECACGATFWFDFRDEAK